MKKSLIILALVAAAATSPTFAGEKPAGGKVSAIADGSITVANKKTGDQTFKTSSDTKVLKADGTSGSLSDLKSGEHVKVTPGTSPDQAAKIQIVEHKKKSGKSDE